MRRFSTVLFMAVLLAAGTSLFAQGPEPAARGSAENPLVKGLTLDERFEGTTADSAALLDFNSTLGYNLNPHFGVEGGIPMYLLASRPQNAVAFNTVGFGNAYVGFHWSVGTGSVHYASSLVAGLPTAGSGKGLGTGRVMVGWDNRFDHRWGRWTPYLDVDPGNGINNVTDPNQQRVTPRRPFLTLGKEVQLEAGTDIDVVRALSLTFSGYYVEPWGAQKVYSLIFENGPQAAGATQNNRVFETAAVT